MRIVLESFGQKGPVVDLAGSGLAGHHHWSAYIHLVK